MIRWPTAQTVVGLIAWTVITGEVLGLPEPVVLAGFFLALALDYREELAKLGYPWWTVTGLVTWILVGGGALNMPPVVVMLGCVLYVALDRRRETNDGKLG
jgi:hypothetical protein